MLIKTIRKLFTARKLFLLAVLFIVACQPDSEDKKVTDEPSQSFDTIIHGGSIYDGSGNKPYIADIGIKGDKIAAIGDLSKATASANVDATSKAVSPDFINMLSWAVHSLIEDGRGLSDLQQGVTLEIFGEGESMGPLNQQSRKALEESAFFRDKPLQINWNTLNEYLEYLEKKGVSPNVASFIGATSVRINHLGFADREPTAEELKAMQDEVRLAMQQGALGLGSSLIYAPAFYAKTDELVALAKIVGEYNGMYISHMRSEGNRLLEALDELIFIAESAGVDAEIYHLKAAGESNWSKLDEVIEKVNSARARGLKISADMYTYRAGATGLDAAMPPWVQEGGFDAWAKRLQDPAIRQKVITAMKTPADDWENLYLGAGAAGTLLVGFKNPKLRHLVGKTLAEVAAERGGSPEETALDLVVEDGSRVSTIYFLMSEDNLRKKVVLPWVSFGSDEQSYDPTIDAKFGNVHPRSYGTFSRVLAQYVRDEKLLPLQEAIRKLTSLPANNLKLHERGALQTGFFADIVVFDPQTIQDHATFTNPHQLTTGVEQVWVNGQQVIKNGVHTGATPGRVVRGPGWQTLAKKQD